MAGVPGAAMEKKEGGVFMDLGDFRWLGWHRGGARVFTTNRTATLPPRQRVRMWDKCIRPVFGTDSGNAGRRGDCPPG